MCSLTQRVSCENLVTIAGMPSHQKDSTCAVFETGQKTAVVCLA